jgi:hypothetical protein
MPGVARSTAYPGHLSLSLSGSGMALMYAGGYAEYRLRPAIIFEPFRLNIPRREVWGISGTSWRAVG